MSTNALRRIVIIAMGLCIIGGIFCSVFGTRLNLQTQGHDLLYMAGLLLALLSKLDTSSNKVTMSATPMIPSKDPGSGPIPVAITAEADLTSPHKTQELVADVISQAIRAAEKGTPPLPLPQNQVQPPGSKK